MAGSTARLETGARSQGCEIRVLCSPHWKETMKTTFKVTTGDGNMTLVRATTPTVAVTFAAEEWGRSMGPYEATEAEQADIDYALSLGCVIHDAEPSPATPFVPVPAFAYTGSAPTVTAPPVLKTIFKQSWKRVERAKRLGPAATSSYHLDRPALDAYVTGHWAGLPRYAKGTAPEYLSPDGPPQAIEVTDDLYKTVKDAHDLGVYGVRW